MSTETDLEDGGPDETVPDTSHPHRYDPTTDVCVVDGCERERPEWLSPEDAAAAFHSGDQKPGLINPSGNSVPWHRRRISTAALIVGVIAIVIAVHIFGRMWGSAISEPTDPEPGEVSVTISSPAPSPIPWSTDGARTAQA